jgi:hypothetical protein
MVVRAHECANDSFDRFTGELVTVFSSTDCCGTFKKAVASASQENPEIVPKQIFYQESKSAKWLENAEKLK